MLATELRNMIDDMIEEYGNDIVVALEKGGIICDYTDNIQVKKATITDSISGDLEVDDEVMYNINVNGIVIS